MSEPIRAPATARPGAPPPGRRCNRLLALTVGAVTGPGLVLTAAPAAGPVALSNTIIGGNTGGANPDCAGNLADGPGGHNLIGNIGTGTATGACSGLANGVDGDQVRVPAALLPLAATAGPPNTAALAPISPAIGTGNPTTCARAPIGGKDQRDDSRNATTRGSCDIGAYGTGGAP
jgi:hypothetical protein